MRKTILLLFAHAYYEFCLHIAIRPECGHQVVHIQFHLIEMHIKHEHTTKKLVYTLGTGNT